MNEKYQYRLDKNKNYEHCVATIDCSPTTHGYGPWTYRVECHGQPLIEQSGYESPHGAIFDLIEWIGEAEKLCVSLESVDLKSAELLSEFYKKELLNVKNIPEKDLAHDFLKKESSEPELFLLYVFYCPRTKMSFHVHISTPENRPGWNFEMHDSESMEPVATGTNTRSLRYVFTSVCNQMAGMGADRPFAIGTNSISNKILREFADLLCIKLLSPRDGVLLSRECGCVGEKPTT